MHDFCIDRSRSGTIWGHKVGDSLKTDWLGFSWVCLRIPIPVTYICLVLQNLMQWFSKWIYNSCMLQTISRITISCWYLEYSPRHKWHAFTGQEAWYISQKQRYHTLQALMWSFLDIGVEWRKAHKYGSPMQTRCFLLCKALQICILEFQKHAALIVGNDLW